MDVLGQGSRDCVKFMLDMLSLRMTFQVGKFVHPLAAVYLTAAIETLLEELVSQCAETAATIARSANAKSSGIITAIMLEQVRVPPVHVMCKCFYHCYCLALFSNYCRSYYTSF